MALISSPVPNLVNGVSQQPPSFRLPSQGEVQENCVSSAATGLLKRPPLEHLRDLLTVSDPPPFTHFIPGDTMGEQFAVVISGSKVQVFDQEGTAQTVSYREHTDILLARKIIDATAGASVTSEPIQILIPDGHTHITLETAATSAVGLTYTWERSATGTFTGEEVTFSTETDSNPSGGDRSVESSSGHNWLVHNGQYLRLVATRASATNTSRTHVSAAVLHHGTSYLEQAAASPRDTLKATTEEDTTYILNTNVQAELQINAVVDNPYSLFVNELPVSFLGDQPAPKPRQILTYIRTLQSGTPIPPIGWDITYRDPTLGTDTTIAGVVGYFDSPIRYALGVVTVFEGTTQIASRFDFVSSDHIFVTSRKDFPNEPFSVSPTNSREGNIFTIPNSIQNYSDLPLSAPDDFYVEVRGAPDSEDDNYWVKFVTDRKESLVSEGYWEEAAHPFEGGAINAATMPHTLVRNDDGTFSFGRGTWDPRIAGDDETNPTPSFIGNTITDVFVYSNRLGLLSGPSVIFSELDYPSNFYRTTVLALLDTAPIDITVASLSQRGGASTDILHAADFNRNLLLFSGTAQAQIDGGTSLTPLTIAAPAVSEFDIGSVAPPVFSGKDLYFSSDTGNFSSVREYFRDGSAESNNAVTISAHVPKYIPKNLRKILAFTTENTLVALSDDDPGSLYIYTYFWQGDEKIQSSWSRWTFDDSTIRDISAVGSELFLLVEYDHSTLLHLEKMDLSTGAEDPFSDGLVYLDRRVNEERCTVSLTTFGGGNTATEVILPYKPDEDATYFFIQRPNLPNQVLSPGTIEQAVDVDASTKAVTFLGDWRNQHFYIGHTYESLFELSEFRLSVPQASGGSSLPVHSDRVTVRAVSVAYNDTGEFSLEVTQGHTGRTSVYPVVSPGGLASTSSGTVRALVMAKPPGTRIVARNASHRPFGLLSAEYSVEYTELGRG